ncbi:Cell cycle response regulator CtrA [bacterium HR40]|nr:Cell cycle response regulator CtrA [bacterium HR40]
MRVLLLTSDTQRANQLGRRLAVEHEVRTAGSLAEALLDLVQPFDRPDLIVTDLDLPDAQGYSMLRAIQDAALGTPILVCDPLDLAVAVQVEAAALAVSRGRASGAAETMVFEQHRVQQLAAVHEAEWRVTLEEAVRRAAELAAERASAAVLARLECDDREGVRLAVRLARGFEALKSRFLAGVATGLAGALLVAVGTGIAALLRRQLQQ